MSKKHFFLLLGALLIVLVSLAISAFSVQQSSSHEAASDFYQRHPDWTWSVHSHTAYRLDCFRRELQLKEPSASKTDASNQFMDLS